MRYKIGVMGKAGRSRELPQRIIIVNPKKLEKAKKRILRDGILKLYVVSDFDKTLTKLFVGGQKVHSLISILRNGNYLPSEYNKKAKALFNRYYPIETDFTISPKEKKKIMKEWWKRHFQILIKFGLNKKHIRGIINSGRIKLREGTLELLNSLHQNQIPLLIISSSGLGSEPILQFLAKENSLYPNIYIISNSLKWNKKGYFIGVKNPIVHTMSKDGNIIQQSFASKAIEKKQNVLLLGNNIEDCQMINGLNYQNAIKVGFLNEEINKSLDNYKKFFDILVLNDGDMNYVNKLLSEIT